MDLDIPVCYLVFQHMGDLLTGMVKVFPRISPESNRDFLLSTCTDCNSKKNEKIQCCTMKTIHNLFPAIMRRNESMNGGKPIRLNRRSLLGGWSS
jgi:hypothetical protein